MGCNQNFEYQKNASGCSCFGQWQVGFCPYPARKYPHLFGRWKAEDEVSVGKHIDGIEVGPEEDILLLSSRKNKTVQILLLAFIQNFDISNSPFKGRVNAPVEIAVFGDFQ